MRPPLNPLILEMFISVSRMHRCVTILHFPYQQTNKQKTTQTLIREKAEVIVRKRDP